ncbi:unnamed protein product [Lactuca saligna]|uniref:MULE transposase domain-containing protein n=1 Tax=Lactuca saligna TaxID=75948 RepID=A0AA35V0Q9_LACSI|nr:unnamed protein product [Lactuca saligna]
MEEPEVEDDTKSNEDEVDVIDKEVWEHELDDEEFSMKRARASIQGIQKKDMFLNKLCPNDEEEEDPTVEQLPPVYPVHNSEQEWDQMAPVLGMKFTNPSELKHCLTNYAVKHGYDLWLSDLQVGRETIFQCTYRNPKLTLRKMKDQISNTYNIIVSIGQCRNAKKFALSEIEVTLKEHYSRLWDYGTEIKRANPGSTVSMEVDNMPDGSTMFKRFYVCFRGVRDGWVEGCRRVIGIDGWFLKGICKGELLAAVGRDSNNHMFPIGWAVVTVENKETWKWFLDLLMDDIERGNGNGLTILSDGHKGLIEAIKERVPHAEHRLCARHILANFNTRFKGNISSSLGNLSLLIELDMGLNEFNGSMPSSLGNCKRLIKLGIDRNNITGEIPRKLFELSTLSISLNLGGNQLSGELPQEVGNLKNLNKIILENNRLLGDLPTTISSCSSLVNLDISNNLFQGTLPSSLRSLRAIQTFDASQNNFTAKIPT